MALDRVFVASNRLFALAVCEVVFAFVYYLFLLYTFSGLCKLSSRRVFWGVFDYSGFNIYAFLVFVIYCTCIYRVLLNIMNVVIDFLHFLLCVASFSHNLSL